MMQLRRDLTDPVVRTQHKQALDCRASGDAESDAIYSGPPRIFVSIVAFRDPECQSTLNDLFAKASCPENIRVGLVRQMDFVDDVSHLQPSCEWQAQIREIRFDWRESQGVCWARFLAQSLWRGEEYFLQID